MKLLFSILFLFFSWQCCLAESCSNGTTLISSITYPQSNLGGLATFYGCFNNNSKNESIVLYIGNNTCNIINYNVSEIRFIAPQVVGSQRISIFQNKKEVNITGINFYYNAPSNASLDIVYQKFDVSFTNNNCSQNVSINSCNTPCWGNEKFVIEQNSYENYNLSFFEGINCSNNSNTSVLAISKSFKCLPNNKQIVLNDLSMKIICFDPIFENSSSSSNSSQNSTVPIFENSSSSNSTQNSTMPIFENSSSSNSTNATIEYVYQRFNLSLPNNNNNTCPMNVPIDSCNDSCLAGEKIEIKQMLDGDYKLYLFENNCSSDSNNSRLAITFKCLPNYEPTVLDDPSIEIVCFDQIVKSKDTESSFSSSSSSLFLSIGSILFITLISIL
ncbi:hypothetical protein ACTA71_005695 [Dictyostelium dimigraforme]